MKDNSDVDLCFCYGLSRDLMWSNIIYAGKSVCFFMIKRFKKITKSNSSFLHPIVKLSALFLMSILHISYSSSVNEHCSKWLNFVSYWISAEKELYIWIKQVIRILIWYTFHILKTFNATSNLYVHWPSM
jgi:hypothetical protein